MLSGHGGVVIGSEMSGGIKKVTISNCVFDGTDRGIRIKAARGRGGVVEDIRVDNIVMKNIKEEAIILDLFYDKDNPVEPVTERTPIFRNIHISNVTGGNVNKAGFVRGIVEMPIQNITFSKTKYPQIRRHFLAARRRGWPRTLVLNRAGADQRRERLLEGVPTRDGFDRDEYPPAVGRGRGKGLERGRNPRGWKADVAYVPSSENRSHGSTLGLKLRRFCDGTRFRYVFY